MENKGTRIGVVVRVRPLLSKELKSSQSNNRIEVLPLEKTISLFSGDSKQKRTFEFDEVFDESVSQDMLYANLKLDSLIKKVLEGFNATIFAYGPTGSGKTFTMEGFDYDKNLKPVLKDDHLVGLIPRIVKSLFEELKKSSKNVEFTVYCTYVQIYKEGIYDLLNPAQIKPPGLKLRWNQTEDFFVENLSIHPCYTATEVLGYYSYGVRNKVVAGHNANANSSRSHCILTLNVEALDKEKGNILTSKLQLVDLAGSEKISQTGNEGLALKESIEINKALFTLRQVISTLSNKHEQETNFVPYRDSKLTSLLKQSIGGNSYCLMIACIAPLDNFFEDNLSTLAYATKASCISNEPVKNIDPKSKVIKELKKEVKRLKSELKIANDQIVVLSELSEKTVPRNNSRIKHFNSQSDGSKLFTPQHRPDSDFSEFMYSPEILSEKLYDSVKLIRDLMNSNKKLKDMLQSLSQDKKNLENENSQLHTEIEDLQEKVEMLENGVFNKPDNKLKIELWQVCKEKEQLVKRLAQIEKEYKGQAWVAPNKNEWPWKSKRTVMRNKKTSLDVTRPLSLVGEARVGRMTPKSSYRPLSQDYSNEISKQEAINTLTQILTRGVSDKTQ